MKEPNLFLTNDVGEITGVLIPTAEYEKLLAKSGDARALRRLAKVKSTILLAESRRRASEKK